MHAPVQDSGRACSFARIGRNVDASEIARPNTCGCAIQRFRIRRPPRPPDVGADEHRLLREGYVRQIELVVQEGVDLIALEMVDHPRYAEPAVAAALESGLSVWLGVCVHSDERDRGDGPEASITAQHRQVAQLAQGDAFDAVCVMHTDIEDVGPVLELIAGSWDGPVGAYPHHGVWKRPSWQFLDLPAERFVAPRAGLACLGSEHHRRMLRHRAEPDRSGESGDAAQ